MSLELFGGLVVKSAANAPPCSQATCSCKVCSGSNFSLWQEYLDEIFMPLDVINQSIWNMLYYLLYA